MKKAGTRQAACLLLVIALGACASQDHPASPLTVVLFDVSGSTRIPGARTKYLEAFTLVAEATAKRHGRLYGEWIGANSSRSDTPIAQDFAASERFGGNQLYQEAEARKQVAAVVGQAKQLLARPSQAGTDILSGLVLAARLIARHREDGPVALTIFSDMASNHPHDLYRANLGPRQVERMIRSLRRDGQIPDLQNVSVYVSGAGVSRGRRLTAERNFLIQNYWTKLFATAGARLDPGNYTARLMNFP